MTSILHYATGPNVRRYGARGDGTTDDTAAVQAALDAGRGVLVFPPGTYRISGATITRPVAIFGYGATITGGGFAIADTHSVSITGLFFSGITASAVSITRGQGVTVENCRFDNLGRSAVRLENPGAGAANRFIRITGNHITRHNQDNAVGYAAIQAHGRQGITQEYIWIDGNYISGGRKVGIGLDLVARGWIRNNRVHGDHASGEGIALVGQDIVCGGNVCENAGAAGILYIAADWAAPNLAAHVVITDNIVTSNDSNGIQIAWYSAGTLTDLTICGNISTANSDRGLAFVLGDAPVIDSGAASRVLVANNILIPNQYGARWAETGLDASGITMAGNIME